MRRAVALAALSTVTTAGVAAAAGPTIKASVKPDTAGAHSTLKVTAKGPFSAPGLPTAVQIDVQKGFRASAKAVAALCNPHKLPCPNKSKVGSGEVVANVGFLGRQSVPFTLYLGKRQHKRDIASVVLAADVFGQPEHATGRLLTTSKGNLEILFNHLPSYTPPPQVTVTLKRFSLSAHAVREAKGKTYSLITNPAKCSRGNWTGVVTVNFQSQAVAQSVLIRCTK
jgi:hypothetical protein